MTPLAWLVLVVIVIAIVAVAGLNPRGGRPVVCMNLMGVAWFVLLVLAVIVAFIAASAQSLWFWGVMPTSIIGATALSLLELLVA